MAAPRPLTSRERAEILRRCRAGESRNVIARAVGRSGSTVSRTVAAAGLSFARAAQVAAATEVRRIDLAARRQILAERLHEDAERLRAQLWEPHLYFDWGGGQDHDYDERIQPEPTPADKRALMGAVGQAIEKSLKLAPPTDDTGTDAARSMLGALADGIRRLAQEGTPGED